MSPRDVCHDLDDEVIGRDITGEELVEESGGGIETARLRAGHEHGSVRVLVGVQPHTLHLVEYLYREGPVALLLPLGDRRVQETVVGDEVRF